MRRAYLRLGTRAAALATALLLGGGTAAPDAATAATLLAGRQAAPVPAVAAQQATALIDDRRFIPLELLVSAGTTVTWTNQGQLTHTTTSQGAWDSGRLAPGASWSRQFDTPGTFAYVCTIHPNEMRATVVVGEASGSSQATGPNFTVASPSAPPNSPLDEPSGGGSRGTNSAFGGINSINPGLANVGAIAGPGAAAAGLVPQNGSGVTGEATLLQLGATTTVNVSLSGLAPGSAHAGHIHQGSCNGPILFPLETITANANGEGNATAIVDAPLELGTWWVQYHASDSPPGPPITCGQVAAG